MYVKDVVVAGALLIVNVLSCLPVVPPLQQRLEKPELYFVGMAVVGDPDEGFREALHLNWTLVRNEGMPVRSFTLFRRFPSDSFFDVFLGSQSIPADTTDFYDELVNHAFPESGIDSVYYRICAVDTFGRAGDTSDIGAFVFAPQAEFVGYDVTGGCFKWESWIRSGVSSWCTVWHESDGWRFTSERQEEFPFTDQPARFSACFPDSLQPPVPGRWYYALFIRANETNSLKVGSIDVQ